MVTANQYKAVLSDHLYPVMKHFYPDGSGLFQDDNAYIHTALNGLMIKQLCESHSIKTVI